MASFTRSLLRWSLIDSVKLNRMTVLNSKQVAWFGTTPPSADIRVGGKRPGVESAVERKPWTSSSRSSFFAHQGEDGANNKEPSTPATAQSSKAALEAIVADMKELKKENPGMSIEEKKGKEMVLRLSNKPEVPPFKVVLLDKDNELGFESASSSGIVRTYKRNEFGEWNCTTDGHNLHGLFVRDLLPHVSGMPRFASK